MIAGTGRAGTSVLVKLLDALGLETELSRSGAAAEWDESAAAGSETIPIGKGHLPYVMKSPWMYQFAPQLLQSGRIKLDGVVIPIRNLQDAARSRITVELAHLHRHEPLHDDLEAIWNERGLVPGGAVYSLEQVDQERLLAVGFFKLVESLVTFQVPHVFMQFPRFCSDAGYAYSQLKPFLPPSTQIDEFQSVFEQIMQPDMIRVDQERSGSEAYPDLLKADNSALKREIGRMRVEIESLRARECALTASMADLQRHHEDLAGRHHIMAHQLATADGASAPPGGEQPVTDRGQDQDAD